MRVACHILTSSLLAWSALVPVARAGQLDDLASAKSLTDAQKQSIRTEVEAGVKRLGSADVPVVTQARQDLSAWADGAPTPVFRGEFSKVACGPLGDLVLRGEPIQAVNAIEVLRVVRTYEALQQLAKLSSSAAMANTGIRLAASRALVASIDAGTDMNAAQADGLVRAITEATKREVEWACSMSQLGALASIAKRSGMDAKVVSAARNGQVSGLSAIATRVAKGDAKDAQLMKSASRVLAGMRKDLANAPAADRAALAGTLTPVVDALRKAAAAPPAGIDADVAAAYAETGKAADLMAELLKASGKPAAKPTGKPASKPAPKKPAP
ncbi:MAG: hypothetical protein RLZZ217_1385 [Planctomycetota bacterium]|jgi:hypothetical protein